MLIQTSCGKLASTGRLQRSTVALLRHRVESFDAVCLVFGRPALLRPSDKVEAGVELRDVLEEQGLAYTPMVFSFGRIECAERFMVNGASSLGFCCLKGPISCERAAVLALRLVALLGFGSLEAAIISIVMFSKERCIVAKIPSQLVQV